MKRKNWLICGILLLFAAGCTTSASNDESTEKSPSASGKAALVSAAQNDMEPSVEATPKPKPKKQPLNAVCPDPSRPCQHRQKQFDDWELPFKMPANLQPNKPYESAVFYAVILKTYDLVEECDGGEYIEAGEKDRRSEQRNHPRRKVFASYECPNMAAVTYDFEGKWDAKKERLAVGNFIAVYAGETIEEAEEILRSVKSRFPKALIKQMKAGYERIEQ